MAARVGLTVLGLLAMGPWLMTSLFLFVFRCDDTCSGNVAQSGRWLYTGQLLLTLPCVAAGLVGLVLMFVRSRWSPTPFLVAAAAGGVIWLIWVPGNA